MTKLAYRFTRRHGTHAAGDEIQLTVDAAIQLENEAPGAIEGPLKAEEEAVEAPAAKRAARKDV
jgi:hypothetical protein